MRTLLLLAVSLLLSIPALNATPLNLIPQPAQASQGEGAYTFTHFTVAYDRPNAELDQLWELLAPRLSNPTGLKTYVTTGSTRANIVFKKVSTQELVPEAYRLSVRPSMGVVIEASTGAGFFYAMQTLMQLLPSEIKSPTAVAGVQWVIPEVTITDAPRFAWRGMMLDVSRHWFTKAEVMAYIDQMAEYKYNKFHWHLTDDQGWRIQINALPRLTSVGAWRVPRVGNWWTYEPPQPGEAPTYGGFYTQADIAEVVEYARRRYIEIVPEIDVPGHSLAALVAYPELACFKAPSAVNTGQKFYGIDENTLCVGNSVTMQYMDKIFTEVAALFPSSYIHVGGDECWKGFWKKCPKCQALMTEKGLKNTDELQSYFIRQMETLLKNKGKKLIGWDEILEGGLAPEATVMSWRGMEGGIAAAKQGHHVIMTPSHHCYLDLYQGEPTAEPDTYSMARLSDSYAFEPVPEGVAPELILGGQANLWTESVPTFRHAQYMTWPRAWALSEVLWSPAVARDWGGFVPRVENHFVRADWADINYARSMYNAIVTAALDSAGQVWVSLASELQGVDIYYSFDNTIPDLQGLRYTAPVRIPKNATRITVATYRDGEPLGALIRIESTDLRKRAPKQKRVVGNL